MQIKIKSSIKDYQVKFYETKINNFKKNKESIYLIDKNVYQKYRLLFSKIQRKLIINSNEKNKSFETLGFYIKQLIRLKVKRSSILIAVGGGIVQDIAAFITSVLFRGMDWIFYPTTLLAQADSCIGSKSSINFYNVKNLVGTYNPPNKVILNINFLKTLSKEEVNSGIGEILKCILISGKKKLLNKKKVIKDLIIKQSRLLNFIKIALNIKKKIIEIDEFDNNIRKVMNYGHSFGHAIEAESKFKIPHGIAITLGMDLANFVSYKYKMISYKDYKEINSLLILNSNKYKNYKPNIKLLIKYLSQDKKNTSSNYLNLILLDNNFVKLTKIKKNNKFLNTLSSYYQHRL